MLSSTCPTLSRTASSHHTTRFFRLRLVRWLSRSCRALQCPQQLQQPGARSCLLGTGPGTHHGRAAPHACLRACRRQIYVSLRVNWCVFTARANRRTLSYPSCARALAVSGDTLVRARHHSTCLSVLVYQRRPWYRRIALTCGASQLIDSGLDEGSHVRPRELRRPCSSAPPAVRPRMWIDVQGYEP
jgi:hypothetical protein